MLFNLWSVPLLSQEIYPRDLPKVDLSKIWYSSALPEHNREYDPFINDIVNQTNLDSLIRYVRGLSGEDSVWINGSKVRIEHRVSNYGNDLAADFIYEKLSSFALEVHDQVYSPWGRNIYAVQPGYLYPDEHYIICAHYDAVTEYCADDNASGVAAVLEAARILSQHGTACTLVYALWDEEEIGLYGSRYYAAEALSNEINIRGVLNIDMIGWDGNDDRHFDIHTRNIANSDSIANLLLINASLYELDINPVIYDPGSTSSDHLAFWQHGYGGVLLIEGYFANDLNHFYHSNDDRIDKFNLDYFHDLSKLAIGTISDLAQITSDTLLVAINPGEGYWTQSSRQKITGVHTHFSDSKNSLRTWLSKDNESILADSVVVKNNSSFTAYFYIPDRTSTGMWNVNVQTDMDGLLSKINSFEIFTDSTSTNPIPTIPEEFYLEQNFPNPFNNGTTIGYQLAAVSDVELSVYNLLGQKVETLVDGLQEADHYLVQWDASRFASGIYFYHLKAGAYQDLKKMVLIK